MNLFIYSDESGVFDKAHNDYYVFGGLICATRELRDSYARAYKAVEDHVRADGKYAQDIEMKAAILKIKERRRLYQSLNSVHKFGVVVYQRGLHDRIFASKKTKQRYLDYAYKIAVKRKLQDLIQSGSLNTHSIENIYFCLDQHTTATDGKYELREALEQELIYGTFNWNYSKYYSPILPTGIGIDLKYYDSKKQPLIRAADIIANRFWHAAIDGSTEDLQNEKCNIITLP